MDIEITIRYTTETPELVNDSVAAILENTLPFMADNVEIHFDTSVQ